MTKLFSRIAFATLHSVSIEPVTTCLLHYIYCCLMSQCMLMMPEVIGIIPRCSEVRINVPSSHKVIPLPQSHTTRHIHMLYSALKP